MTEYVRFSRPEVVYGEKRILYSELELINFIKRLKNYKKLRSEEFVLKIALKNKIDELQEQLQIFQKLLPQDKLPGLYPQKKKEKEKEETEKEKDSGVLSLDQELEIIRRKLERLEMEGF